MNKNYKTLELDLILDKLAGECSCDDAKDLARKLKPSSDISEVELLLWPAKAVPPDSCWNNNRLQSS